ncbi:unnamed protein product [Hymenolepis diminuta]|uniref:Uncharacterized protein n=1 Tax=Hymenolepis diminuta TaxID=6216 RepID=A0A564YDK2_HYMDI|nr:unnamed protein product [Hymenolepis diminuta]
MLSLAEKTDNIIENAGSPRVEEISHTPHPISTKNELATTWEERMQNLMHYLYRKINYAVTNSTDAGVHNPDVFQNPKDVKAKKLLFNGTTAGSVGKRPSSAVIAKTDTNSLFLHHQNSDTSYLIDSTAETFVHRSDRTS